MKPKSKILASFLTAAITSSMLMYSPTTAEPISESQVIQNSTEINNFYIAGIIQSTTNSRSNKLDM